MIVGFDVDDFEAIDKFLLTRECKLQDMLSWVDSGKVYFHFGGQLTDDETQYNKKHAKGEAWKLKEKS
jgi:hypothetical protein